VCRGIASKIAEGTAENIVVGQKDLHEYLGPAPNMPDLALRIENPGVVVGLAWTPHGGEILFIEAVAMDGGKGLTLTGQLGDVMKESASTALSYIRANAKKLNVPESFFGTHDIHIHVPEGSIPKDGPSAGVAMLTCLTSLMAGQRVKKRLAMSGEITLRGEVLPVGGIKEKVIAAHRAGIKTIVLPLWNQKDMEDVPDYIKAAIDFHFTDKMEEILALSLDGFS
jgi:ATP-dependent Lon protease